MGNDDNSPLTGVTGGGLPAEIWKETMVRVHEGLPANPLPDLAPAAPEPVAPPPQPQVSQQAPDPERQQRDNIIQQVLRDLLGPRN